VTAFDVGPDAIGLTAPLDGGAADQPLNGVKGSEA